VLNRLGGEDKPGRKLLPAVKEVRLIIEPPAAALAATRATGKDPIASTAGSRTTSPTMPPLKKSTPKKVGMPRNRSLVSTGPGCIAARPAPAGGTAGHAAPAG